MTEPQIIHLTSTGLFAGRRLCDSERDDGQRNVHYMHAPVENADFRAKCCPECLKFVANEAYEDGEEMPDWVVALRANAVASAA